MVPPSTTLLREGYQKMSGKKKRERIKENADVCLCAQVNGLLVSSCICILVRGKNTYIFKRMQSVEEREKGKK